MASDPEKTTSSSWADAVRASGESTKGEIELSAGALIASKYRLVRPAGFGGMAQLWVAKNEATAAEVCVKVLLYASETEPDAIDRFRREAHAAAQLSHRGIVRVFDLIELEHGLVIVMELLRGESLFDRMARDGKLPVDAAFEVALPVLSALAYAHTAGVVHRDLKPDNIFLAKEPDGEIAPKILDFGVSKLTTPGVPRITTDGASLGTPGYMSPEQARGSADTDARSDVFAMGIVLYEMLSGKNPFASESYHSVVASILERVPPPPANVPEPVARVVMRALEKKRDDRWPDARAFADALRAARVDDRRVSHAGPSLSQVSVPPVSQVAEEPVVTSVRARRSRVAVVGVVAACALLAVVAGVEFLVSLSSTSRAGASAPIDTTSVTASSGVTTAPDAPPASANAKPPDAPSAAPSASTVRPRPQATPHTTTAPTARPSSTHAFDPGVVRNPGF